MTDETNNSQDSDKPTNRTRKPKQPKKPGKPRRKSAKKRQEAHQRDLDLIHARTATNPAQRRIMTDCLVRTWIDHETLIAEPDLQDLMWVQYRYLPPLERTELFAQEYIAAYRRAYARWCGSADDAAKKQPCIDELVRNDLGEMNCLWKARATADTLGVPYDMYLDAVMAGKLDNGKWIEPPLPNQLYARVDPARLRDRPTSSEISERLYGPGWDARFFADAYRGDPVQEVALALLRQDVWAALDPAVRLSVYLVERRAITEVRARTMFGDELVDLAIAIGGGSVATATLDHEAYRPHCFGYPYWVTASPCRSCPSALECSEHSGLVRAAVRITTGSDNPRADYKRKLTAERQRRWYAKHKRKPGAPGASE